MSLKTDAMSESVVVDADSSAHHPSCLFIAAATRGHDGGWPSDGVSQKVKRCGLATMHLLVERQIRIARRPNKEGAGHVATIPTDLCAEVEEDHFAPRQGTCAWASVRQGCVSARQCCNIKGECLCAIFTHATLQGPR